MHNTGFFYAGGVVFLSSSSSPFDQCLTLHLLRYELYVVDLFENKQDDGAWKLLFGAAQNQGVSAFQVDTPIPVSQTWIFPYAVRGIGITHTQKGITQKAVLFALKHTDQVVKLPKDQLLNPRRPVKMADGRARVMQGTSLLHEGS